MYNPRENFEKTNCVKCLRYTTKLCSKEICYSEHLEAQNKELLDAIEAIDEALNDNCTADAQLITRAILNSITGKKEEEV